MKQSVVQIVFYSLIGLFFVVSIAVLIECCLFSWTGFLYGKAGSCDYKSIKVPTFNAQPQKMSFDFDTQNIAREMSKNKNYLVKQPGEHFVVVLRKFGIVNYKFSFRGPTRTDNGLILGTSYEGTLNGKFYPEMPGGEKSSTPDYILRENAFTMIDDLPITDLQKDEMKKYVKVNCFSTFKGF